MTTVTSGYQGRYRPFPSSQKVLLESVKWETKNMRRMEKGKEMRREEKTEEERKKEANWFSRAFLIHAHPCMCSFRCGNQYLCIYTFWWKREMFFSERVSAWEFLKFNLAQQILSFKTQMWSLHPLLKIGPQLFMTYWKGPRLSACFQGHSWFLPIALAVCFPTISCPLSLNICLAFAPSQQDYLLWRTLHSAFFP